ncbi:MULTISPECIES: helix-turn-helix domain-containing protein [unclassified Arenibacter]|uniref:helix-turn-helix domain-containing protein n=1 Tax=unclassified Arenibacter TaxID=2615047 RepID=UPI002043A852|nr:MULTISPECIES: helix-turn-helix domain-containing protein [unclassified Arenibacter]
MSNRYMASFLNISERQVSRYISELKAKGWIEETAFNGRKRYLRSLLHFEFMTGDPDPIILSGESGYF